MKKGKKIALIGLMVVAALAGTIGGVALAQSGDEATTTTQENARYTYLERVCEIYQERTGVAIDTDDLKEALCQAGEEIKEQTRNRFWQRLVDEGIIDEEQLAEWQDWLADMPDMPDNLSGRLGQGLKDGKRFAFGLGYGLGKVSGGWCQPDSESEE